MAQGTIKTLVTERGFGFIQPEGAGSQDLFFHRTDVEGTTYESLRVGDSVTYELGTDQRRGTPKATRVQAA